MAKKYTETDYYTIIWHFHTEKNNSVERISKLSKVAMPSVCSRITKYLSSGLNLGEVARLNTLDEFLKLNI